MEHYGGLPINSPEIEPLEVETYVTLEQSILDEIILHAQGDQTNEPIVEKYLRISAIDAQVECVDVILTNSETWSGGAARQRYDLTVYQYQQDVIFDGSTQREAGDVDTRTYTISIDKKSIECHMYMDLASGTRIGRHRMNAVEHSMLLDELVAVHTWQLAAQRERAILNK
jgi:hypothetical protein